MTRKAFDRLESRYREIAFAVVRVESVSMTERIQQILGDVLAEGQTRAEFERSPVVPVREATRSGAGRIARDR